MTEKQFNNRFDKGGYWDNEINEWFEKNVRDYEEEFKAWLETAT